MSDETEAESLDDLCHWSSSDARHVFFHVVRMHPL